MKILPALLATFTLSSAASAQGDTCDGLSLWTMAEVAAHSQSEACLVVLYDSVYDLKAFADIHRGGSWSITRNCGEDATFGFEALQCIPGVPDHTRGILNMVLDVKVGVIKGSPEDPCGSSYPPSYSEPDFEACAVYDVVTCSELANMPNGGKWAMEDVENPSSGCVVKLYDYVYDVGSPPQPNSFTPPNSGSLTFADKHGGGKDKILAQCNKDMTGVFEALVDKPGAPDHTKGSLNAILPYLVGVIEGSLSDPCVNPPPPACSPNDIEYWSMSEVASASTGCISVVLGKVYDLAEFSQHHYGGQGEILEKCGDDITNDFLEKSFHNLAHLGAIQQFQRGLIKDSMADPCSSKYTPFPNPTFGEGGSDGGESGETSDDGDGNPPPAGPTNAPAPANEPPPGDDNGGLGTDGTKAGGFWNFCFPGEAFVDARGKGQMALKDLKIGDQIMVDGEGRYETVYSFGHKDEGVLNNYFQFITTSGAQVEISKDHLVFVEGKGTVPASHVRLEDKLYAMKAWDSVASIKSVTRRGAYAPLTPSGTLIVNGFKVSSFVALQDSPSLVIGGVPTGLPFHWLERTFELPHQFWCICIASCTNEEYSVHGISTWAEGPYKAALWFLGLDRVSMAVVAIPLLLWLCVLSGLEWFARHHLVIAIIGTILLGWNTFFAVRTTMKASRYYHKKAF